MKYHSRLAAVLTAIALTATCITTDVLARSSPSFGGSSSGRSSMPTSRPPPAPSYRAPTPTVTPRAPSSFGQPSGPAPQRALPTFTKTPEAPPPSAPATAPAQLSGTTPKPSFDSGASGAKKAADNKAVMRQAEADRAKATPNQQGISPRESQLQAQNNKLRERLANKSFENRELRQQQAFGNSYNRASPQIFARSSYGDPFGNMFFWMWLMDRPRHDQDMWVYQHQHEMDQGRLNELKQKDSDLERRLRDLERSGTQKIEGYKPPGLTDEDLMYSEDAIAKAAASAKVAPVAVARETPKGGTSHWFLWTLFWLGLLSLAGFGGYKFMTQKVA